MQRDLVEQRKWFTKDEYTKSLALPQLAPGPLAAQLAICLDYVHSRVRGATLVAGAFILPSFVMTVAISWLYVRFGGLSWMQAAFYGVGATVIGIITIAAYKLARLTMAKDKLQWLIFVVMAVVTAWTESEILWLFLLCGVAAMVVHTPAGDVGGLEHGLKRRRQKAQDRPERRGLEEPGSDVALSEHGDVGAPVHLPGDLAQAEHPLERGEFPVHGRVLR